MTQANSSKVVALLRGHYL